MTQWERVPGRGRYAHAELERRFLVVAQPPASGDERQIEDRYLHGLRLRLRRISGDGTPVHKLTQKVRPDDTDPAAVAITNIYLDADEWQRLCTLPADVLVKTRRIVTVDNVDFAYDELHGRHDGIRLAEVEVSDLDAPLPCPPWLGGEVTHDDRFSGGRLAAAADDDVRALLACLR